jgi:signal transduction histidine kinase
LTEADDHAVPNRHIAERRRVQLELELSDHELQKMIAALNALRQQEQRRLAHDMHDDLGQLLAAMKIDLAVLQQQLPQDNSVLVQQLRSLHKLVDAMVTSVRRIIADLPPKIFDELSVFKALECMIRDFEKRYGIQCILDLPSPEPAIERRIATPLYRIAQEALNNIVKHAQASRVDVKIILEEDSLILRISDNGRGMAPDDLQKAGSFGLAGMRERVAALGGTMHIDSTRTTGTAIMISIPLPRLRQ